MTTSSRNWVRKFVKVFEEEKCRNFDKRIKSLLCGSNQINDQKENLGRLVNKERGVFHTPKPRYDPKREAFHEVIKMDSEHPRTPNTKQSWELYNPSEDRSPRMVQSGMNSAQIEHVFTDQKDPIPSIDRGIYNDSQHEDQLLTLRAELERLKEDKANREAEMQMTKREMVNIKSSLARNQRFLMELKDEMLDAKTKKFGSDAMNMKNLL